MTGTQFVRTTAMARIGQSAISRQIEFPSPVPIDPVTVGQGDGWQLVCENFLPGPHAQTILFVWLWQRETPPPPIVHLSGHA